MLIRSQDKLSLTNLRQVTDLNIVPSHDHSRYTLRAIYPHVINDDYAYMTLGRFSSRENAIKVLDMIQAQYQSAEESKIIGILGHKQEFTFTIPTDKEMENYAYK